MGRQKQKQKQKRQFEPQRPTDWPSKRNGDIPRCVERPDGQTLPEYQNSREHKNFRLLNDNPNTNTLI